jgi:hypothetical protein
MLLTISKNNLKMESLLNPGTMMKKMLLLMNSNPSYLKLPIKMLMMLELLLKL